MEKEPFRADFYFSPTYQASKKGRVRRVQFKDGCRMLPEQRGFAQLDTGQVVEFSMMQPPGRDVLEVPAWKAYEDFIFLGQGIFDHWEDFHSAEGI